MIPPQRASGEARGAQRDARPTMPRSSGVSCGALCARLTGATGGVGAHEVLDTNRIP
jgi:hypothetical protein